VAKPLQCDLGGVCAMLQSVSARREAGSSEQEDLGLAQPSAWPLPAPAAGRRRARSAPARRTRVDSAQLDCRAIERLQPRITFIFVTHDQEEALTMSDRIAVMSWARSCRSARRADIYDRPAEALRRDFIGESTSSKADVVGVTSGARGEAVVRRRDPGSLPEGFSPAARSPCRASERCATGCGEPERFAVRHRREHRLSRHDTHFHLRLPGANRSSCGARTAVALVTASYKAASRHHDRQRRCAVLKD